MRTRPIPTSPSHTLGNGRIRRFRRKGAAVAIWALASVSLVVGIAAVCGPELSWPGLGGVAAAQAGPPQSEPGGDLRSDKLRGPFEQDSTPGRGTGFPMLVGGVVIMGVVLVLVLRSRRGARDSS